MREYRQGGILQNVAIFGLHLPQVPDTVTDTVINS